MTTPMQKQYNSLKDKHKDCILLFRLGDFYEAFNDDAKTIAKVLGITLTGRGKGDARIPMAGIPHHSLDQYLPKLVKNGHKVAIAEQMEEATPGQIVERDVVKIITAGTITDEKILNDSKNNYILGLANLKSKWGISYVDLSTGEFRVDEFESSNTKILPGSVKNIIAKLNPKEIIIPDKLKSIFEDQYSDISKSIYESEYSTLDKCKSTLNEQFETKSLKGFGINSMDSAIIAAAEIINYLQETQKTKLGHIVSIKKENHSNIMELDEATVRNLELVTSINSSDQNTLFGVLNDCQTSMGQRLLYKWILNPLINQESIDNRLDIVNYFSQNKDDLKAIRGYLDNIYDIERILARIGLSSANARDLKALQASLEAVLEISKFELSQQNSNLMSIIESLTDNPEVSYIIDLIDNAIVEDPDTNITEGGIINTGYDSDLDELRDIITGGKDRLANIQKQEIERTGITSLKVKFNNVFGYFIEVSKSNLDKVPEDYVRKQTLTNSERYIIDELKKLEEKILTAEDKIKDLEYELFIKIRSDIAQYIPTLQEISKNIAKLDVLSNFAQVGLINDYCKPKINDTKTFNIEESRHPVVEKLSNEQFITNDLSLSKKKDFMILTGPNMSGKSTYIRQIALISLMAQIGCFVPANSAKLGLVDKIFTRVGASDNLVQGESTFMVEMNETSYILNNATEKSLVILDEIGRGTSTYDGVSLAWAITEYIHNEIKSTTLFATHYHELVELHKVLNRLVNYNVEVKEDKGRITFMRKIVPGATDKSYGIYVAKLAGVPEKVINKANKILDELESNNQSKSKKTIKTSKPVVQFSFDTSGGNNDEYEKLKNKITELNKKYEELNINNITPLEAMEKLKKVLDDIKQLA